MQYCNNALLKKKRGRRCLVNCLLYNNIKIQYSKKNVLIVVLLISYVIIKVLYLIGEKYAFNSNFHYRSVSIL